jgi:uncharacterized protein (DUF885 family)
MIPIFFSLVFRLLAAQAPPPQPTPAPPPQPATSQAPAPAQTPPAPPAEKPGDAVFRSDVDRFLEAEFRLDPNFATEQGDHRYDAHLTDLSQAGIDARVHHASMWLEVFKDFDGTTLSPAFEADREWIVAHLQGVLFWQQEIKVSERNPNIYLPTSAVYALIKRNFAPPEERMRSATGREVAALTNLLAANKNLKSTLTPKVFIDIALQQMPGTIAFFKDQLPAAFSSVPDGPDKQAFKDANDRLLAAITDYQRWLDKDLGPRALGRFAIGPEAYGKMLSYSDMADFALDDLEAVGQNELLRLQEDFRQTAAKIDSSRTAEEVYLGLAKTHPKAEELLGSVRSGLSELRAFVAAKKLAGIPSEVVPTVQETPPFARATSFASMDTPGPFEQSPEAYFNVTLPEASWPDEKREQLLEFFSPFNISDFSVHEVYPGHYVQFLNNRLNPDKIRALYHSGANAEGWALYCEEMMLDQGLRGGDPKYRLAQIQAALQRACRYLAGIRMHIRHMTVDEAATFFEQNAFMTPHNAMVEALRGTIDPGYLRYQLGKLMILKLRDDVKKKEGARFDLGRFHDRFLGQGAIPIKLIRRAMLGSDGPLL